MSSDRSRRRDKLGDGYKEVVAQQGRVILDRDFNAVQSLTAERIAHDALDFVGPCGTPDDGFAISTLPTSPPEPRLWSPPAFPDPDVGERFDFLISPGTMFVGGERAYLPGRQAGHSISYSYFDQPDWIAPTQPDFLILRRLTAKPARTRSIWSSPNRPSVRWRIPSYWMWLWADPTPRSASSCCDG